MQEKTAASVLLSYVRVLYHILLTLFVLQEYFCIKHASEMKLTYSFSCERGKNILVEEL